MQPIYKTLTNKNKNSIFLFHTSVNEIKKVIENCDNKYSIDTLGFNMHIIQLIKDEVSPINLINFNICLQVGIFPVVLKTSKIIPIYKSGAKNELSNYRPISIYCIIYICICMYIYIYIYMYNIIYYHKFQN